MKVRFSRATLGTTPARQRAPDHTHVFAHAHANTQNSNKVVSRAAARAATEKHFTPKTESVVCPWRRATGGKVYRPTGVPAGAPAVPSDDWTS